MKQALGWMDRCSSVKKRIFVAEGNGEEWGFYRIFGFSHRMMMLDRTKIRIEGVMESCDPFSGG